MKMNLVHNKEFDNWMVFVNLIKYCIYLVKKKTDYILKDIYKKKHKVYTKLLLIFLSSYNSIKMLGIKHLIYIIFYQY